MTTPAKPSDRPAGDVLAEMDRAARLLLEKVAPVRFAVARTELERRSIYALRCRTAIEEGWIEPGALPEGLEKDRHDDRAVHLIGWDGVVMAATARLVFPGSEALLPTEEAFGISVVPHGQVVDLGRGLVAHPYRRRGHAVFFGLLSAAWLEARARGFDKLCGTTALPMLPHYRAMGFEVAVLGASRCWWGEERIPMQMDGTRSSPARLRALVAGARSQGER